MKRIIFIALISYLLVIFQKSFFGFYLFSVPVSIIILLVTVAFLESRKTFISSHKIEDAEWIAIFGGLFSDIFSSGLIGPRVLALVSISLFIKFILRKYGKIPSLSQKRLF